VSGERVLTRVELNRALLARQMLLERAQTSIPQALERMAGLQAQYAPAMYTDTAVLDVYESVQLVRRVAEERSR